MLPNLFIIGAAKAGTTSLHAYLDRHPEIHMSAVKEPSFFAEPTPDRPFVHGRVGDRAAYEALFESDAPVRGEASPSYSLHAWRTGVPERIHALVPDARFVYLVRDPIERVAAHYAQAAAVGSERRTLREALAGAEAPDHPYVCASRYATQVEQYLPLFDLERFLVVDQADLLSDRLATLREVFAFLSVDREYVSPDFEQLHNTGEDKRAYSAPVAALRSSPLAAVAERLPPGIRRRGVAAVKRALSSPAERPPLDDDLRARLAELLAPEADRLRALTGKRFPTWAV